MSVTDYANTHLGQELDNGQGGYKGECVSLAIRVAKDVYGIPYGTLYCSKTGGARDLYEQYDRTIPQYFDRIANNPNDLNQLPQVGDFIVWGSSMGTYGHVAVVISPKPLKVFQQLGTPVFKPSEIKQYPNYNGVLGWLRPKQAPQGGSMTTDKAQLDRLYEAVLRRNRSPGEGEDVYLGKDSGWVFDDLYKARERSATLQAQQEHEATVQRQISDLQAQLAAKPATTPANGNYVPLSDVLGKLYIKQ